MTSGVIQPGNGPAGIAPRTEVLRTSGTSTHYGKKKLKESHNFGVISEGIGGTCDFIRGLAQPE
jgi:hypothetical protein